MAFKSEIIFDNNPLKTCFSGQRINGIVQLLSTKPTIVKEIYLEFDGRAFCGWRDEKKKLQIGSKTYFNVRLDLPDMGNFLIAPGLNRYPFQLKLPHNLPTSFEGTYGYIRYTTSLIIVTPLKKINRLTESFTIIKPLNLNSTSTYRMPMEVRKFKQFNQVALFCCCKTAFLKIFGRLPVSGYCPGQTMNLKLDIINDSYLKVLQFLIEFIKEVTYTANNGSTKIHNTLLDKSRIVGCRVYGYEIQSRNIEIIVPSLTPTNYTTKCICRCRYMLRVTAQMPFGHRNLIFKIPVVIGTYPISNENYSSLNCTENHCRSLLTTYAPLRCESCEPPPYTDDSLDPPSYEEAML